MLSVSGPRSYTFTRDGGSQSLTFTCNKDWSVSTTESWLSVSPSSGSASDGETTVTIKCNPNTTYDPRTATLTITVEDLAETITVKQETGIGLIVSPKTFDLTNAEQVIEIEVQKNVQYSITIDDAGKSWITHTDTKGLATEKAAFSIAANDTYDNREAKITFNQTDGGLSETVVVKQSQTNGLFITTPEYDLSNGAHTLTVEVKANVDYEVISQTEWVKYVSTSTKALTPTQITLQVDANETYDDREGQVVVKQKGGDLMGTIIIRQDENYGILVSRESANINEHEQKVEVEVKYNVDFEVIIPTEAQGKFISSVEYSDDGVGTKALSTRVYRFGVTENTGYDPREVSITFKQRDGALSGTFTIIQAQTDVLHIQSGDIECAHNGGEVSISLLSNVDYEVSAPEWITIKESNKEYIKVIVSSNDWVERRATISIQQLSGELNDSINILQRSNQESNEIWYTTNDNKPVEIININSFDVNIVSNENIDGKGKIKFDGPLQVIGYKAFYCNNTLLSIQVPKAVKEISENAFDSSWRLKSISLPSSLTSIKDRALAGTSISSIILPESLQTIGFEAFTTCASLTEVYVPASVTTLGPSAFSWCTSLSKAVIEANINELQGSTFYKCEKLVEVKLPDSISSFGIYEFNDCGSLNTINIPDKLEKIQYGAFMGCPGLKEITLPESIGFIGELVFDKCIKLKNIYIKATTPPFIYSNSFSSYTEAIFVPMESVEKYTSADYGWPVFVDLIKGYSY